jgi:hypothetical protein
LPTLRFEAATLDEAVQAARQSAGPEVRVVGASRVRRGGIAGFFAHEHIEVEVEVPDRKATSAPGAAAAMASRAAELQHRDPLEELVTEMASEGPTSVLDLAEKLNALEGRDRPGKPTREVFSLRPRPEEREPTFEAVLERIAREPGPPDLGPPVNHDPVLLTDLGGGHEQSETPGATRRPGPGTGPVISTGIDPSKRPLDLSGRPDLVHRQGSLARSLAYLGLPVPLCQEVLPAVNRESLEGELARALKALLPPVPALPGSAKSIMAVVGPARHAVAVARALAAEVGAPPEEVTIATQRKVWSRRTATISSPEEAAEQRRSWRWRPWPSVVAVEQPVRPFGAAWSASVLRALEPAFCWGAAEAAHKPEDLSAWSEALGGLDALALVDLEGTTTPASALSCSVPVGRLDGATATAEAWASLLCARLPITS